MEELSKYLGLKFIHGQQDCYSIIRNFYREEYNINLPDFCRPDDWWNNNLNLYMDNYEALDFFNIGTERKILERGDVLLFHIRSPVPNHAAIFIPDNYLLHHTQGRLSSLDTFSSFWNSLWVITLRHREVAMKLEKEKKNSEKLLDLMEMLPLHKKQKYVKEKDVSQDSL